MTRKDFFAAALAAHNFARDAVNNQPPNASADESDLLSDAYATALDRLLLTNAADVSDLRAKMEVLFEDTHSVPPAKHVQSVMQDLLALTDAEPSRTFNPDTWLRLFESMGRRLD